MDKEILLMLRTIMSPTVYCCVAKIDPDIKDAAGYLNDNFGSISEAAILVMRGKTDFNVQDLLNKTCSLNKSLVFPSINSAKMSFKRIKEVYFWDLSVEQSKGWNQIL